MPEELDFSIFLSEETVSFFVTSRIITSSFLTFEDVRADTERLLNNARHSIIRAILKILFTNINYIIKHIEIHDFFIVYCSYDRCNKN